MTTAGVARHFGLSEQDVEMLTGLPENYLKDQPRCYRCRPDGLPPFRSSPHRVVEWCLRLIPSATGRRLIRRRSK